MGILVTNLTSCGFLIKQLFQIKELKPRERQQLLSIPAALSCRNSVLQPSIGSPAFLNVGACDGDCGL